MRMIGVKRPDDRPDEARLSAGDGTAGRPGRRVPSSAVVLGILLLAQTIFLIATYEKRSAPTPKPAPLATFSFAPRISAVNGAVSIVSPFGSRRAERDERVEEGDAVETFDDGRCVLTIEGRAELLLGPASRLEVKPGASARGGLLLFLRSGTAYASFLASGIEGGGDTDLIVVQTPNLVVGPERDEPTEFLLSVE
jgi:hypothetical protein